MKPGQFGRARQAGQKVSVVWVFLFFLVPCWGGCSDNGESSDQDAAFDCQDAMEFEEHSDALEPADFNDLSEVPDSNEPPPPRCALGESRLIWSYQTPGPDTIHTLGFLTDADGDAIADILIGTDVINILEKPEEGYLVLVSGATGKKIWSLRPITERQLAGPCSLGDRSINSLPDTTGDGVDEVLYGSGAPSQSAFVIDGYGGEILWYFDTHDDLASGSVYAIRAFPDVTGDQLPEVLFGASDKNDRATLADGSSGAILWRYMDLAAPFLDVAVIDDLDNDAVSDALLGLGTPAIVSGKGSVVAVSGKPFGDVRFARSLWVHETGGENWTLAVLNDVNQDGKQDVAVGIWYNLLKVLSGHDGSELWSVDVDALVLRVVRLDDVDGDNLDDVAITSSQYGVCVFSGKDGSSLWRGVENSESWSLDPIRDLSGDGINEVVVGSFDSQVRMYSGNQGALLWEFDTGDQKVFSVRTVPDLSGDGFPDVIAGTQYAKGSQGGGTVFALNGCPE